MPISLHTNKIKDEKNAFIEELYRIIVNKEELITGKYDNASTLIHKYYLTIYIMEYYKKNAITNIYYDLMLTSVIESEALIQCGFINAAVMQLRCAVESTLKLLYYELHPIEWVLHQDNKFDLSGIEYREFLYKHPKFSKFQYEKRETIEQLWGDLCEYSHFNINVINEINLLIDIKTVFSSTEENEKYIKKLKMSMRVIIIILFLLDGTWLKNVEKSYFDYVFEILFGSNEIRDMKINLEIE